MSGHDWKFYDKIAKDFITERKSVLSAGQEENKQMEDEDEAERKAQIFLIEAGIESRKVSFPMQDFPGVGINTNQIQPVRRRAAPEIEKVDNPVYLRKLRDAFGTTDAARQVGFSPALLNKTLNGGEPVRKTVEMAAELAYRKAFPAEFAPPEPRRFLVTIRDETAVPVFLRVIEKMGQDASEI